MNPYCIAIIALGIVILAAIVVYTCAQWDKLEDCRNGIHTKKITVYTEYDYITCACGEWDHIRYHRSGLVLRVPKERDK